jgi:type III restriction enzyme
LFADAEEKRGVGAGWEERRGGKCLFVMPEGKDLEKIRRKISGNRTGGLAL